MAFLKILGFLIGSYIIFRILTYDKNVKIEKDGTTIYIMEEIKEDI